MSYVRFNACLAAMLAAAAATEASAAQRTFVASYGNDAQPCSLAKPCRSFAAALAKTDFKGQVLVLDSAGYGRVTIAQSATIAAPAGVYAGISVFPGSDGITIAGFDVEVVLRGLAINGQGGGQGVNFAQGARLAVEDCEISNMGGAAIYATAPNATIVVANSVLRDSGSGFQALGSVEATLDRVHSSGNHYGVLVVDGARVAVVGSVLANNEGDGVAVSAYSAAPVTSDATVTHTTISGSDNGLSVSAAGGNTARVVSDANVITEVFSAAFAFGGPGGTRIIYSPGNNTVGFNNGIVTGGSLTTPCCIH